MPPRKSKHSSSNPVIGIKRVVRDDFIVDSTEQDLDDPRYNHRYCYCCTWTSEQKLQYLQTGRADGLSDMQRVWAGLVGHIEQEEPISSVLPADATDVENENYDEIEYQEEDEYNNDDEEQDYEDEGYKDNIISNSEESDDESVDSEDLDSIFKGF